MSTRTFQTVLAAVAILVFSTTWAQDKGANSTWQEEFGISTCNLLATGRNPYFVLEPGFQLVLQGGDKKLQITVLNETRTVDGVNTRVVEEKEWAGGKLHEVTKSYFAMCEQSKDVFYFGEEVDNYENGKVVNHDGSWLAGTNGSKVGLMMPGTPKSKMKFYKEMVPGVSMARMEIVSLQEKCNTPAGTFSRCMKLKETSAIDITAKEYKYYAPGIGLIRDESLRLIKYGFIKN